MNKLKLLYALTFAVVTIACSSDDEKPSFKQADFYGTWQKDGSEEDDCTDLIKINETIISYGTKCAGVERFYSEDTYEFKNNSILFEYEDFELSIKYVVKSKTATTFKADLYWDNVKMETQTFTKL